MAITVVTPASSTKLTTVASAKEMLGIASGDTTYDTLLGSMIDRATAAIETYCNRKFGKTTIDETLAGDGMSNLRLARFPVISITSITLEGVTVPSTEYTLQQPESGLVFAEDEWEFTYGKFSYTVRYQYGYVLPGDGGTRTLPYDIEQACLELTRNMFVSKDRDSSIVKESVAQVYSTEYGSLSGQRSAMGPEIESLLAPYRMYRI